MNSTLADRAIHTRFTKPPKISPWTHGPRKIHGLCPTKRSRLTHITRCSAGIIAASYVDATVGPTFSSSSVNVAGSKTMALPTGAVIGDVMIMAVTGGGSSSSGWTIINTIVHNISTAGSGVTTVLARVFTGTEGGIAVISDSQTQVAAVISAYSNAVMPTVNHIYTGTRTQTAAGTMTSYIQAPLAGTVVHIFGHAANGSHAWSLPSDGTTTRGSVIADFWGIALRDEIVTAGTTVSRTTSLAPGNASWAAFTILLISSSTARYPWIASASTATGNSGSITIAAPGDMAVGDLIVIQGSIVVRSITTNPSGFTPITDKAFVGGAAYNVGVSILYKIAVSGDIGATWTFTASGGQVWGASALAIRDVDTSNPFVNSLVASTNSAGSTITFPTRTPVGSPAMGLIVLSGGASPLWFTQTLGDMIPIIKIANEDGYGIQMMGLHPVAEGLTTPPVEVSFTTTLGYSTNQLTLRPLVAA